MYGKSEDQRKRIVYRLRAYLLQKYTIKIIVKNKGEVLSHWLNVHAHVTKKTLVTEYF